MLINIYIPPTANNTNRSKALNSLYQAISEQQTAHPAGFLITAGDLSHADLKVLLPKLPQHVDFPTRGDNSLYLLYTTCKGACKASPPPPPGSHHHAETQNESHQANTKGGVCVWLEEVSYTLKDCFNTTD